MNHHILARLWFSACLASGVTGCDSLTSRPSSASLPAAESSTGAQGNQGNQEDLSGSGASDPVGSGAEPLPAAFKGYELYAWDDASRLHFTLITGTNRPKTIAEVKLDTTNQQDGEWVVISGQGREQLLQVLGRVPTGTDVGLQELTGLPPLSAASRTSVMSALAARSR